MGDRERGWAGKETLFVEAAQVQNKIRAIIIPAGCIIVALCAHSKISSQTLICAGSVVILSFTALANQTQPALLPIKSSHPSELWINFGSICRARLHKAPPVFLVFSNIRIVVSYFTHPHDVCSKLQALRFIFSALAGGPKKTDVSVRAGKKI